MDRADVDDDDRDPSEQLVELLKQPVDPRTLPVRYSRLKLFGQSAAHYHHACQIAGDDSSISKRLGSGAHAIAFGKPFAKWDGDRRAKGYKAWAKDQDKDAVILTTKEHRKAEEIAAAITKHERASQLLFDGTTIEQQLTWTYREVGGARACSSTPDSFGKHHVVELKTTRSADPKWFTRDAQRMGYHGQLAFYGDALLDLGLSTAQEFYIVAIESKPPYPVQVYRVADHAIGRGRILVRSWMERLAVCESSGVWPAYSMGDFVFDVADDQDEIHFEDEVVPFDDGGVVADGW